MGGGEEQEGLLGAEDVAANLFAKHPCVAVDVEVVVLQLEGHTYFLGETVECRGHVGRGIGGDGAHLCRAGQQDGRLEAYHLEVFVDGDVGARLEVHVVLLSLAHFLRGAGEYLQQCLLLFAVAMEHKTIGLYEHRIAGEDGRIGVPLAVHRGAPASHLGVVHQVVVEQGMVVVGLYAECRRQGALYVFAEEAVGEEQQGGAQALSAGFEGVLDGGIEPLGL